MTTVRIHDRTGATAAATNHELAVTRTTNLAPEKYPYLTRAGSHLSALLDLDQAAGMQAAIALSPQMKETARREFLEKVVGSNNTEACDGLLAHIETVMNEEQRICLNIEIAQALGEVH